MEEVDREQPVFDQLIPVKIQIPGREVKVELITIRVLNGTRVSRRADGGHACFACVDGRCLGVQTRGGHRSRILRIEITDEADLFFLYSLVVAEEDFHVLKHDQRLLVDFLGFPDKFIELLRECVTTEERPSPRCVL